MAGVLSDEGRSPHTQSGDGGTNPTLLGHAEVGTAKPESNDQSAAYTGPSEGGYRLLVLASGWLPWWLVRVQVSDDSGTRVATFVGTAWQVSSRWSAAIAVAVAAVAVWLVWRLVRRRVPLPVWLAVLSAVTVSVFLTVVQLSDVEPINDPEKSEIIATFELDVDPKPESEPGADRAAGWMKRDHLVRYRSDGLNVGLGWGLWAGLAGMVLAGLALAAAKPRGTGVGSDPPAGSET